MADEPEVSEVDELDDDWEPSERVCPVCGSPTERAPWWDDTPEMGGAVIGDLYRCTKCDWFEDV